MANFVLKVHLLKCLRKEESWVDDVIRIMWWTPEGGTQAGHDYQFDEKNETRGSVATSPLQEIPFNTSVYLNLFEIDTGWDDKFAGHTFQPVLTTAGSQTIYYNKKGSDYDAAYQVIYSIEVPPPSNDPSDVLLTTAPGLQQGPWTQISPQVFLNDMETRFKYPFPDQGGSWMCGPAAILYALLRKRPKVLKEWLEEIYEHGGCAFLPTGRVPPNQGIALINAPSGMLNKPLPIHPATKIVMNAADYLFMLVLRDSLNEVDKINHWNHINLLAGENTTQGTMSWHMEQMMRRVGLSDYPSFEHTVFAGAPKALGRAVASVEAGGFGFLAVGSGDLAKLLTGQGLAGHWGDDLLSDHWIALIRLDAVEADQWAKYDASSGDVYIPADYVPPNGHNKNLAESSTAAFHSSGRICLLSWGRPYSLELTEHQMEELVWYVIDGAARDDIP